MLLSILFTYLVTAEGIHIKKPFPNNFEVHNNEVQRYNMVNYFYSNSLQFSQTVKVTCSDNMETTMSFEKSKEYYNEPFKGQNITHSHFLQVSGTAQNSILFTLSCINREKGFYDLTRYFVYADRKAESFSNKINVPSHTPISLFAFFGNNEQYYILIELLNRTEEKYTNWMMLMKFSLRNISYSQNVLLFYAPNLANTEIMSYESFLIAYNKNTNRNDNKVYIYELDFREGIGNIERNLVMELDGTFFNVSTSTWFKEIVRFNDSFFLSLENDNAIYEIKFSPKNRIPRLVNRYPLPYIPSSISVSEDGSIYIASEPNSDFAGIIEKRKGFNLENKFHFALNLSNESYSIVSTCNTKNFHITHIRDKKDNEFSYILAASISVQYGTTIRTKNLVSVHCFSYNYDLISTVSTNSISLYKFKFPELVFNFTNINETKNCSFEFNVMNSTDSTDSINSLTQKGTLKVYKDNNLEPSMNEDYLNGSGWYNYKGTVRSLDVSNMFRGLINTLEVHNNPIVTAKKKRYDIEVHIDDESSNEIKRSAEQKMLMVDSENNEIHLIPFRPSVSVTSSYRCSLRLNENNNKERLGNCSKELQNFEHLGNFIVKLNKNYFISINKQGNSIYINMYQYNYNKRTITTLREDITYIIKNKDEIQGIAYHEYRLINVLAVHIKRGNEIFIKLFKISYEEGKFGIRELKEISFLPKEKVIRIRFLKEAYRMIVLCEDTGKRTLKLFKVLDFNPGNVIQLENMMIEDFIVDESSVLILQKNGNITKWSFNGYNFTQERFIVLPEGYKLSNYTIDILSDVIKGRRFLYMILENIANPGSKAIYLYDTLRVSRQSPYYLLEMDCSSISIIDLKAARVNDKLILLLITSKNISFFMINPEMLITVDGYKSSKMTNESIEFEVNKKKPFSIGFNEFSSFIIAKKRIDNDSVAFLSDEINLNMHNYVQGYGVNYTTNASKVFIDNFVKMGNHTVQDRFGENNFFKLALVGSKLILYKDSDYFYSCGVSYQGESEHFLKEHCNAIVLTEEQSPERILGIEYDNERYFTLITKQAYYIYYNSFNNHHRLNFTPSHNTRVMTNQPLGLFIYINVLKTSFTIYIVNATSIKENISFHTIESKAISEAPMTLLNCTSNKNYNYMYCLDNNGTLHSFNIDNKPLNSRSYYLRELIERYNLGVFSDEPKGAIMMSTEAENIFIYLEDILIRCNTMELAVDCTNNLNLVVVPSFGEVSYIGPWIHDGATIATLIEKNGSRSIRIIDSFSAFENTEVMDANIGNVSEDARIYSMVIDSEALNYGGILIVENDKKELMLYNFSFYQLLQIKNNGSNYTIKLITTDAFNNIADIDLEIISFKKVKVNTDLILGWFLYLVGFGSIIGLTILHAKKIKAKKKGSMPGYKRKDNCEQSETDESKDMTEHKE